MKGTLLEKKQKNKKLLIILGIVGLITVFNFGKNYFSGADEFPLPSVLPGSEIQLSKKNININFDMLKILRDNKLDSFKKVEIQEMEIGRKNPYIPYYEIIEKE